MATISIQINNISDQECADVLSTALEGGIGYWCAADDIRRQNNASESMGWRYQSFLAIDADNDDEIFGEVNYDTIRRGVNLIVAGDVTNSYIRNMVLANFQDDEPMDADGADICIQAGLLNEISYG